MIRCSIIHVTLALATLMGEDIRVLPEVEPMHKVLAQFHEGAQRRLTNWQNEGRHQSRQEAASITVEDPAYARWIAQWAAGETAYDSAVEAAITRVRWSENDMRAYALVCPPITTLKTAIDGKNDFWQAYIREQALYARIVRERSVQTALQEKTPESWLAATSIAPTHGQVQRYWLGRENRPVTCRWWAPLESLMLTLGYVEMNVPMHPARSGGAQRMEPEGGTAYWGYTENSTWAVPDFWPQWQLELAVLPDSDFHLALELTDDQVVSFTWSAKERLAAVSSAAFRHEVSVDALQGAAPLLLRGLNGHLQMRYGGLPLASTSLAAVAGEAVCPRRLTTPSSGAVQALRLRCLPQTGLAVANTPTK